VRTISTPSPRNTSSKAPPSLLSRSWIKKRIGFGHCEFVAEHHDLEFLELT
jgi:hypothetical protein